MFAPPALLQRVPLWWRVVLLCVCAVLLLPASVAHAATPPGTRDGELVADGAWCWFQDPRAVHYVGVHDRTYIGFVTSTGDVRIVSQDAGTAALHATTLAASFQRDDHAAPGLLVRPDGRIAVFYSRHTGSALYMRLSTRPEDITSFGPERVLLSTAASGGLTYGNPIYLPAEHRTYLFFRGVPARPNVMWSDDNLQTWTAPRAVVVPNGTYMSARPYVKYATNGTDTILLAMTDGHPRDEATNSIYALTLKGWVFRTMDGTAVGSLDGSGGVRSIPIPLSALPKVYEGASAGGKAWLWSAAFDSAGMPVLAFATFPTDTDHRYWYGRWNGTSWTLDQFAAAGGSIDANGNEPDYSGGIDLDQSDPQTFYTSRQISGEWEIQRWHADATGAVLRSPVSITSGSTEKNVRPVVPWGPPGEVQVLWMRGSYDTWAGGYDTQLRELTSGRAPTTARISVSSPSTTAQRPVIVSGRVVQGDRGVDLAGVPAELWATTAGVEAHRVDTRTTDVSGLVSFAMTQSTATTYTVRYAGSSAWGSSSSPPAMVGLGRGTGTSARLPVTRLVTGAGTLLGTTVATSSSGVAGARIQIWRQIGSGSWSLLAAPTTDSHGHVALLVRPMSSTRYQARYGGTMTLAPSESPRVSVQVRRASASRVSLSATSLTRGASVVVGARVMDAVTGHGLASVPVQIWQRIGMGGWSLRFSGNTDRSGLLRTTFRPDRSLQYQVRFPGSPTWWASSSSTMSLLVKA